MSARDDFGSSSGTSSAYGGGSGGLGNGGIGGGRGGGGMGGGAGVNGGLGSRTGVTTGSTWHGNTAFGRPGGMAQGYATRDPGSLAAAGMRPVAGAFSQFNTLQGKPMIGGLLDADTFRAPNASSAYAQAYARWQQLQQPQVTPPAPQPVSQPQIGQPVVQPVGFQPPAFNPYAALRPYASPYGPEAYAMAGRYGLGRFLNAADAYHNWAGSDRGYMTSGNLGR